LSRLRAEHLEDWERFTEEEALIQALWEVHLRDSTDSEVAAAAHGALDTLFDEIRTDRISKLQQLKPLEDLLSETSASLLKLGADSAPEVVAHVDVVFLDLYLSGEVGPPQEGGKPPKSSLDRARERASRYLEAVRSVTNQDPQAVPPAFVLISSFGTKAIAQNFRRHVKQTASRFRFVSKQSIERNEPHALLAIADIFRTCAASAVIEPFRKAWPRVVDDAKTWVLDRLLELDISDFGRLYLDSLKSEGLPIEDYVKELVAGALAERVACAFSDLYPVASSESPFANHPGDFFEPPSNAFADLYSATRITRDRGYRGLDGSAPISGDLYLAGALPKRSTTSLTGRKIIAVMSPVCDLLSRPGKLPNATSLLLLEGTLEETFRQHQGDPQTVLLHGRFYEVAWAMKSPQTVIIDALKAAVNKEERTWLGRLKAEHFLALQHDYLRDMGRVGLLKSPGVFEPLAGEIRVRENGNVISLGDTFGTNDQFAYMSPDQRRTVDKQPVFLSGVFVEHFRELLVREQENQARHTDTRAKARGLIERMSRVVDLVSVKQPAQHEIQNYLRVDLLAARSTIPPASAQGVILIDVWKP